MSIEIEFSIALLNQSILDVALIDTEQLLKLRLTRAISYDGIRKHEESLIDGLFVIYHKDFIKLNEELKGCACAIVSNAYFSLSAFSQALKYAEKSITENPIDHFAIYMKGISLIGLGQVDTAITALKKSLLIESNFAPTHKNLAICYSLKGQNAKSLSFINAAIKIAPDDPDYHKTKALLTAYF